MMNAGNIYIKSVIESNISIGENTANGRHREKSFSKFSKR